MIIHTLKLNNFLQFYGEQSIHFAHGNNQHITIIHGENGSGKTAMLTAFKWCLYDNAEMKKHEYKTLVSERKIHEAIEREKISISVSIEFEHDNITYQVKRSASCNKLGGMEVTPLGKSTFTINKIDLTGEFKQVDKPLGILMSILPERLYDNFFFDGERIDRLPKAGAREIKDAIRIILGLEGLEKAKEHLKTIIRELVQEYSKDASEDIQEIIKQRQQLEDAIEQVKKEKTTKEQKIREIEKEIEYIESKRADIREIAHLQENRQKIDEEIAFITEESNREKEKQRKIISEYGFTAFGNTVLNNANSLINSIREKGQLPSGIRERFIKDILNMKECICGRELLGGTDAYNKVESYMNQSLPNSLEDRCLSLPGKLENLLRQKDELLTQLKDSQSEQEMLKRRQNRLQDEYEDIQTKLGKSEHENVREQEQRLADLKDELVQRNQEIGRHEERIENDKNALAELSKKEKIAHEQSKEARQSQKEIEHAREADKVIGDIYEALTHTVRKELSDLVNETFTSIIKKDYWAEIDETYTLTIYKKVGDAKRELFQKSTGENQVTSLSFISSLIHYCKDHSEKSEYMRSGRYPLVMDSPFGTLDPEYRESVATRVTELADQVIILLSESQWRGEVQDSISPNIGKEFNLIYNTPHPKEGYKTRLVQQTKGPEFTTIEEVSS